MPKAKYIQIYQDLKNKIETGEYEFQELLPSENQLILTYVCSRNTIRRAISALVTDGYVQTMQGNVLHISIVTSKRVMTVEKMTEIDDSAVEII